MVGLLGPNGAGKTTSFYMIVGLVAPETGRVLVDETDITRVPMYLSARNFGISYLPQEPSVFRKLRSKRTFWPCWRRRRWATGSGAPAPSG